MSTKHLFCFHDLTARTYSTMLPHCFSSSANALILQHAALTESAQLTFGTATNQYGSQLMICGPYSLLKGWRDCLVHTSLSW